MIAPLTPTGTGPGFDSRYTDRARYPKKGSLPLPSPGLATLEEGCFAHQAPPTGGLTGRAGALAPRRRSEELLPPLSFSLPAAPAPRHSLAAAVVTGRRGAVGGAGDGGAELQ